MKSIHMFDVFEPTDEQKEAMDKKRGGHYRKEMDYFIGCATSLFPNNYYSRFTPIHDTEKEFYRLITLPDTRVLNDLLNQLNEPGFWTNEVTEAEWREKAVDWGVGRV